MSTSSDVAEDPFLVTAELAIRSILRSVERHAPLIRMYVKGNPQQSIMTTLLAVDTDKNRVIVDCSPEPELNARLLQADEVVFDTQLDQVTIHFVGKGLQSVSHDGLPALSFPIPDSLRRVQRREYFRVEIPVGEPASCSIPLSEPGKAPTRVEVKMKDISAGGVALLDSDNLLPHSSGVRFGNAVLTLPEVGDVPVDLEVLRVHTIVLPSKKEIVELGCRFVDLPNAASLQVQNYIGRLERRLNAKRRGF